MSEVVGATCAVRTNCYGYHCSVTFMGMRFFFASFTFLCDAD